MTFNIMLSQLQKQTVLLAQDMVILAAILIHHIYDEDHIQNKVQ